MVQWHTAYRTLLSFKSLDRWTIGERFGFSDVTGVVGVITPLDRRSRLADLQPG